jgi:GNAT superfamily N-acetyltransferase
MAVPRSTAAAAVKRNGVWLNDELETALIVDAAVALIHEHWSDASPSLLKAQVLAARCCAAVWANDGRRLVGFGYYRVGGCERDPCGVVATLYYIVCAEDCRRMGVGRRVVDILEREAIAEGVACIKLETVAEELFYRRLGYVLDPLPQRAKPVFALLSQRSSDQDGGEGHGLSKLSALFGRGEGAGKHVCSTPRSFAPPPTPPAKGQPPLPAPLARSPRASAPSDTPTPPRLPAGGARTVTIMTKPLRLLRLNAVNTWSGGGRSWSWYEQIGPCCGFSAALCALQCLFRASDSPVAAVTDVAVRQWWCRAAAAGITTAGEVMSCTAMRELLELGATMLDDGLPPLVTAVCNAADVLSPSGRQMAASVTLVPYDRANGGDAVACRRGEGAHWGVLAGTSADGSEAVLVHGRSVTPLCVPIGELARSNAQLKQVTVFDPRVSEFRRISASDLAGVVVPVTLRLPCAH